MSREVISARDWPTDLVLDTDTVVVGSGAGGAVVATERALAGERVLVLEEGPNVPSALLGKMRPSESVRHVWRDGAFTLAVGIGDSPSINVTMGRCIGGSSSTIKIRLGIVLYAMGVSAPIPSSSTVARSASARRRPADFRR